MEPAEKSAITSAVRRLTFAVWALTAVMSAFLLLYVAAYFNSFKESNVTSQELKVRDEPKKAHLGDKESKSAEGMFEQLRDMPVEKQIQAASVIVIARYQPDGERRKCVISEILKVAKDTSFSYKVGDEYSGCSYFPKADENRGDGVVIFFVGKFAEMRLSSGLYDGRLAGFGNMPLELFRKKINTEQQVAK